jgi:DNA-binding transcriptional MerR regulator
MSDIHKYPTSPAAAKAKVTSDTLRRYADAGIVSPIRDANGRRLFSEADIEKARQHRQLTLSSRARNGAKNATQPVAA